MHGKIVGKRKKKLKKNVGNKKRFFFNLKKGIAAVQTDAKSPKKCENNYK
jgi:hypothetical protein